MNKCLKITLSGEFSSTFRDALHKHAKKLKVEGTVQPLAEKSIRIIVCGTKDTVDAFLDELHKIAAAAKFKEIEIEPFLKDKDYRGVFRIIE
ncbi:MAG TPA: acylphosphatase [Candidatus Limnocylindria bacterium]|nr:acylphosphatase [Candidatus Limnocylindria bacterium]